MREGKRRLPRDPTETGTRRRLPVETENMIVEMAGERPTYGYRTWAEENHYGMRWPGTEGIFSAVKRKFGENCVSRSVDGLEAEGYQRLWIYDYIKQGAKKEVKMKNQG